jgi:hypothetical protein
MTGRRVAWTIAMVAIVALVVVILVDPPTDDAPTVLVGFAMISFVVVGATLVSRVPGNRIGALFLIAGTLQAISLVAWAFEDIGVSQTPIWPGAALGGIVWDITLILPIAIALIGVPLIFPDGHLPSPRFRWIVWLTVAVMTGSALVSTFRNTPVGGAAALENPLVIASLRPALDIVDGLVTLPAILAFGGAAAAVWVRYRRGTPIVRQQTKWLMAVAGVAAVAFPMSILIQAINSLQALADTFFFIGVLALMGLPWAVAIAVMRYRLYDIDRIVSRTIAYAVVTGILAVAFTGVILLLSGVLSSFAQGQTVAVAASTLAVFAIFQPVRQGVQRIVDRRFDRARYDGARTATAFAERLRNETDMETVKKDLALTTAMSMAPASLGIWLRNKDMTP